MIPDTTQPLDLQPTTHVLKCWPEPFQALMVGTKTFEWRKNDRDFKVRDMLEIREWDPAFQQFTGRALESHVTYVLSSGFGIPEGYCVLGLSREPWPTGALRSPRPSPAAAEAKVRQGLEEALDLVEAAGGTIQDAVCPAHDKEQIIGYLNQAHDILDSLLAAPVSPAEGGAR